MKKTAIIILTILGTAVFIYYLLNFSNAGNNPKIENNEDPLVATPSTRKIRNQTPINKAQNKNSHSERKLNARGLIRLDSDIPILFDAPHLDLTDTEILERINNGISFIEGSSDPGPFASHQRPNVMVSSIDQACKLLYRTTPIPIEWFPQWGYEVENYYIFSGANNKAPKDAFKQGFAIQKSNGRSWRYWDKPIDGPRRTEKGPRPDDYPPTK